MRGQPTLARERYAVTLSVVRSSLSQLRRIEEQVNEPVDESAPQPRDADSVPNSESALLQCRVRQRG